MPNLLIPLLVGCAVLAGCGTTVPGATSAVPDLGLTGIPTSPTSDGALQTGSTTASPGGLVAGEGGQASLPRAVGSSESFSGPEAGGQGRSTPGGGITATTVKIGFIYSPNSAAAAAAVSGGSADFGDPLAFAKAAVKRVNATGGIGGRRVELEPYSVDSLDTRPVAQQQQEICAHFTQDRKVFAVVNAGGDIVRACFAKHNVVPVASSFATLGEKEFAADEGYVDVAALTPDSALANLVDSFSRNDYLQTKWDTAQGAPGGVAPVKIGILYPDLAPWQRAVREQLIPGLARRGVQVDPANVVEWNFSEDSSQVTDSVAAFQSAVLRFRGNGVTHVFLVENNGPLFARFAENQNYRPRYALSSANQIQGWYSSGAIPAEQMNGGTGIGWYPTYDLPSTKGYEPPGRAACLTVMQEGGAQVANDNNAVLAALSTCDEFFLLQRAMAAQSGRPMFSRSAVRAGLEALGADFPFAAIPSGNYAPGKRYPINQAWLWAWDVTCTCMKYTSEPFTLRRV